MTEAHLRLLLALRDLFRGQFPYAHLWQSGKHVTVLEILLALRFFIYQYGLVYHLNITKQHNQSVMVYGFSWVVILVMPLVMKTVRIWQGGEEGNYGCIHTLKDPTAKLLSGSDAGILNPGSDGFQKLFFGDEEFAITVHPA